MRSKLIACAIIFFISGCDSSSSDQPENEQASVTFAEASPVASSAIQFDESRKSEKVEINEVIAKLPGKVITQSDIDAAIQLPLFDYEWASYELRVAALHGKLEEFSQQGFEANQAEILLTPPWPPRIALDYTARSVLGDVTAPVTLAIFCSYQSSPCARIQPILALIRELYGDLVNTVAFDAPMPFHRNGIAAANAARCADEQGKLDAFQQGLYSDINQLNGSRYKAIALQLGLNMGQFESCIDAGKHLDKVRQDMEFIQSLSHSNVPFVFINGLYTRGPKSFDVYAYYIEKELARLGALDDIEDRISNPDGIPVSDDSQADPSTVSAEADGQTQQTNRALSPTASLTLSREWLDAQLLNQIELEKKFNEAEHKVNNQFYLLRLEDISGNEFFQTLGLQERDVIMKVNDAWVHSGQNPLWDTLNSADSLSIIVMRKGYPHRYDFHIE